MKSNETNGNDESDTEYENDNGITIIELLHICILNLLFLVYNTKLACTAHFFVVYYKRINKCN